MAPLKTFLPRAGNLDGTDQELATGELEPFVKRKDRSWQCVDLQTRNHPMSQSSHLSSLSGPHFPLSPPAWPQPLQPQEPALLVQVGLDPPKSIVGRNVNWCGQYGKQYGSSPKIKNRITCDAAIPPLDIYLDITKH